VAARWLGRLRRLRGSIGLATEGEASEGLASLPRSVSAGARTGSAAIQLACTAAETGGSLREDDAGRTMTATEPSPVAARPELSKPDRTLVVAAVASLTAGAIHAAAVGAHAEHPVAARVFIAVAIVQLGWGAIALARPGRLVAAVGAVVNVALFGGWVLAKTNGLSFVDGLNVVEPVQFADSLAAGLALFSAVAAGWVALGRPVHRGRPVLVVASVAVLAALSVPGMVEAGNHVHAEARAVVVNADGQAALVPATAAVPTKPYDPSLPIDLSGVAGVTPQQQARAENLVAVNVLRLPQWADPATAEAAGYHSIGDGATGFEHYINWSYLDDSHVLDPDHPESIVYSVRGGKRTLVSAMYMLPPGSTLDTVPDIGGALTQWHIHNNLCFTGGAAPQVVGLTNSAGKCDPPTVALQPVPMIHVWIVPTACGPFSALEGVGAGQVKPGETQACDHVHGTAGGL
jgi:hypothetical protein